VVYLDLCAHVEELAGIEGMWDSRIELGRTSSEEQAEGRKKTKEAHTERRKQAAPGKKRVEQRKEGEERGADEGMRKRERKSRRSYRPK